MTDPHADEYCVVCGSEPVPGGLRMYPIVGIENGCICTDCIEGRERADEQRAAFEEEDDG